MDIFRILSRSTKHAKTNLSNAQTENLPSAGQTPNPQLFGHEDYNARQNGAQTGRKRKRGKVVAFNEDTLPAELDLFKKSSDKTSLPTRKRSKAVEQADVAAYPEPDRGEDLEDTEPQWISEEERKRILRSHKLKIVVLEDHQPPPPPPRETKKSKKRKRAKEEEERAKKAGKNKAQQVFPQPLTAFAQLRPRYGISKRLAENVAALGYELPTEVQLGALPLLLDTRTEPVSTGEVDTSVEIGANVDLLTVAPTGSGKTLAFLIPLVDSIFKSKGTAKGRSAQEHTGISAIVLAPTRELAAQIVNEGRKLCQRTGVKIALMRKGMEVVERSETGDDSSVDSERTGDSENDSGSDSATSNEGAGRLKMRATKRGSRVKADILVSTPLVLLNALEGRGREEETPELPSVRHLVLDEADVLLDPLFRDQTLSVWSKCSRPDLRISFWSATMASSVEELIRNTLKSRQDAATRSTAKRPLMRLVVGLKDSAIPNVTHKLIYAATEPGKLLAVRQLLRPSVSANNDKSIPSLRPPFLIFTQTIERALALHAELLYDIPPEAGGSTRIGVLHSSLSDSARSAALERFRRGEFWVLVTTDLLARGVDFRGLNGVVNYDVPNSAAAYVHRVGRTGRAGRDGGVAVTLWAKEDIPYIKNIANVIAASERLRRKNDGGLGANPEGEGEGEGIGRWLLDSLPTPSKREKQMLKKRGVEARRPNAAASEARDRDGRGMTKNRISTKSGYERREENRRRAAVRSTQARGEEDSESESESDFEGFDR